MTDKQRIKELEKRVGDLEARPMPPLQVIGIPTPAPCPMRPFISWHTEPIWMTPYQYETTDMVLDNITTYTVNQ